jgi:predicted nucleotidyltransferase component of viral defense system
MIIKTDITIKEKLVFPIEERPVLRGYTEYEDVPGTAIIKVYSLKEIAAEKVIAVCDRARNEPRDLYDLWYLCEQAHVDLAEVIDAIANKLEFRGQSLETIGAQLDVKQSRLGRLWHQRLAGQMAALPEFDGVFRSVRRTFRQAGIGRG